MVDVTVPPTTTAASGFWISEPGPVAKRMGTSPMTVSMAVIMTGRNLLSAPVTAASSMLSSVSSRSWFRYDISTTPFITAVPSRAMKPMDAGTER